MPSDPINVLVTGGAGYIGSHVCKYLAKRGFTPITVDNLSRGNLSSVKWGPFEMGDIRDHTFLTGLFKKYKPLGVFHLAAYAYVEESVQKPMDYHDNNVNGSLCLLEVMRGFNCGNMVFSSSCAVYGELKSIPVFEDTPCIPINPYGIGKKEVEKYLSHANISWGLKSVILRFFNAAGASEDGDIGECHDPETHLIPLAVQSALNGTPFKLYGTDYETSDGTCVRDFIHVNDLAKANHLAFEYLIRGGLSQCVNLGSGSGVSVMEILHMIEKYVGREIKYLTLNRRLGDPPILVADITKAEAIIGWTPQYSTVNEIVKDAVQWQRKLPQYK
jgi:UDP-glucose-4-epimerase GalE